MTMKRHYQVILEALLSVLIIIDLLLLSLMTIGLILGIKSNSVYYFGNFDLIIAFLIFLDLIFFRIRKGKGNETKWQFLRENWAYILSIIPLTFISFNIFQLFELIPIIGVIGLLRIYALIKVLIITTSSVRKYPSKTKLDYATFVLLLVLIIGSFLFFIVEKSVNPEVPNYESAMWYSIVSMTTVGYGDIVPVTLTGQIIGVVIILTGMGYLSLVTATLAYSFIDIFREESRKATERLKKTAEDLDKKSVQNEKKLDQIMDKIDKIEKKLDETGKKPGGNK
jgi:voltage-gated potassium channel